LIVSATSFGSRFNVDDVCAVGEVLHRRGHPSVGADAGGSEERRGLPLVETTDTPAASFVSDAGGGT